MKKLLSVLALLGALSVIIAFIALVWFLNPDDPVLRNVTLFFGGGVYGLLIVTILNNTHGW